jgi:hypothetical protein
MSRYKSDKASHLQQMGHVGHQNGKKPVALSSIRAAIRICICRCGPTFDGTTGGYRGIDNLIIGLHQVFSGRTSGCGRKGCKHVRDVLVTRWN